MVSLDNYIFFYRYIILSCAIPKYLLFQGFQFQRGGSSASSLVSGLGVSQCLDLSFPGASVSLHSLTLCKKKNLLIDPFNFKILTMNWLCIVTGTSVSVQPDVLQKLGWALHVLLPSQVSRTK